MTPPEIRLTHLQVLAFKFLLTWAEGQGYPPSVIEDLRAALYEPAPSLDADHG